MKNLILALVFFFTYPQLISNDIRIRIFLSDYNYVVIPQNNQVDTIVAKIDSRRTLNIFLKDFKGKMRIECLDSNLIKREEGNYINSLDILKRYSNSVDITTSREIIKVYSYFQPLRTGEWNFYNSKGSLSIKKRYNNGILIDSIFFAL